MIAFGRLTALAFFPSVMIGLAVAVASRRVGAGSWRTTLGMLAALLLLVPQLLAFFLGSYSSELRPYQQLVFCLWSFGLAAACVLAWRNSSASRSLKSLLPALGVVVMAGVGVLLGWTVVVDYLTPHERTSGRIEGTWVVHHTRLPDTYRVLINGRSYRITADLLSRIHRGDLVDADVGAATSTIMSIRRDVPSPAASTDR